MRLISIRELWRGIKITQFVITSVDLATSLHLCCYKTKQLTWLCLFPQKVVYENTPSFCCASVIFLVRRIDIIVIFL